MNEKMVPHSREIESSIISGCLISDRETLSEVLDSVDHEYFYFTPHKKIFSAIRDLSYKAESVDMVSLVEYLRDTDCLEEVGGMSTLSGLLDCPPPVDVEYACKVLEEKFLLRRTIERCYAVIKRCHKESSDFDGTVQYFLESAHAITDASKAGDSVIQIKEACIDASDVFEKRYKNKKLITGVESGLEKLDTLLSGFQAGNLVIIAARPGMGKSAFALNIIRHAAKMGVGSMMFSLEMPVQQLVDRFVTMETKIDGKKIRVGSVSDSEFAEMNDALSKFYDLPIFIDDRGGLTCSEIVKILRRTVKKNPAIKFAIVDHLQLVRGSNPSNRNLEIGEITSRFKSLAKELRMPIILLSQLNRELEKRNNPYKRPRLSDLRDSGSIEQDADDIVFIYRPSVYDDNMDPVNVHQMLDISEQDCELIIAKQRQGPTGTVECLFFEKIQTFANKAYVGPSELYERKDIS